MNMGKYKNGLLHLRLCISTSQCKQDKMIMNDDEINQMLKKNDFMSLMGGT